MSSLVRTLRSLRVLLSCLVVILTAAYAQQPRGPSLNVVELHRDVSRPLRDIEPEVPHHGPMHEIPLLHPTPGSPSTGYTDPVQQTGIGPAISTSSGLGFEGVGDGFTGPSGTYSVAVTPPDTNGAVGKTQYVQWVNTDFAVFDKATGATVYGPVAGNTLWSGFGGACQSTNDGDVIAQYDKLENRWVMTQLSVAQAPPYLLCIAISTTDDATGSYYRYSFSYSGLLDDYPKVGIWPDAYYVTTNMFSPILGGLLGYSFQGPEVCALNRNSMLAGGASTPVCKGPLSTSYSSMLASDLDGLNQPPAGSPNYILGLGPSGTLYLWKYHVDFVTPSNSTLTGPTSISVAAFNLACSGKTCIPQQGTTQQLDSLGDRLMYRLAYRNQGGSEILLADHSVATTVNGSNTVGVRWYEIHNPRSTPTVYQSSTWAPDTNYRWMGSIAMDHAGDIALGYSVSSGSMYPGIAYTGRQPNDALNSMESENTIFTGTGYQASVSRWGDYSAISVDPVDDCTFWYTNEYLKTNSNLWHTRIASFSFPNCTNASMSPDFSLSTTPGSQTIAVGGATSYTVNVNSLNGYSGTVNLSLLGGCPAGATCTLNPISVTAPSATSTLNVSGTSSSTAGNYTLVMSGTDSVNSSLSHQTSAALALTDFTVSASPSSQTVTQGTNANYTVTISSVNGFSGSVALGVSSGCPTNATCSVSTPGSVPANGSAQATLSITNTGSTPVATYGSITVTAIFGGSLSHSSSVSLTVNAAAAPNYSISANPSSLSIQRGKSGSTVITITPSNGFNESVALTTTCPSGMSCGFNVNPVAGGSGSSTLTINVTSAASRGNYTLTVTGNSSPSGIGHSIQVALKVPR